MLDLVPGRAPRQHAAGDVHDVTTLRTEELARVGAAASGVTDDVGRAPVEGIDVLRDGSEHDQLGVGNVSGGPLVRLADIDDARGRTDVM